MLRRLLKPRAERERHARTVAIVDPLIDRIIAATDPRLAQLKDFRTTLREPVAAARERLGAMIARIPGPIEVGAKSWSQDNALRPLFAQAADAARVFNEDAGTRAFFDANPASDCLGMLALRQAERRVLTTVQHGEGIQAEAARTTVSFGEAQILAPGGDEADVRTELVARSLEYLALRALELVGNMRSQKRELEKERALLQAELRLALKRGAGLGGIAGAPDAREKIVVERDLTRIVAELSDAAPTNLLPRLMDELVDALAHPENHLSIEPCTLALDAMNFAVSPSPQAVTPSVATLRLGSRGPFAVLVARFPRTELRAPENRLAEAAKYL